MTTVDRSHAHETTITPSSPSRVGPMVATIRGIYAFTLWFCLAIVLLLAIAGASPFSIGQWAWIGLGFEVIAVTYVGLRLRKPWVVSWIVFSSASAMLPCLTEHRGTTLFAVLVARAGALFGLLQLWFFTRSNTRRFFGATGTIVF